MTTPERLALPAHHPDLVAPLTRFRDGIYRLGQTTVATEIYNGFTVNGAMGHFESKSGTTLEYFASLPDALNVSPAVMLTKVSLTEQRSTYDGTITEGISQAIIAKPASDDTADPLLCLEAHLGSFKVHSFDNASGVGTERKESNRVIEIPNISLFNQRLNWMFGKAALYLLEK